MRPNEPDFGRHSGGQSQTRPIDQAIAALAKRQNGVVSRRQLVELGLGRDAIDYRQGAGKLHRVHRGVYAVGHPLLTAHGRWGAAVLAGGRDAVLSHRSAGALWQLRQWSGRHEVTLPTYRRASKQILWHTARLLPDEVTIEQGIRVTSPTRTVFDLAALLRKRDLERAIEELRFRQLRSEVSLPALLERYPRARGTAAIREILAAEGIGTTRTRNDFEESLIALVDRHGLPRPQMNRWMQIGDRWVEADAVWPEQRLIVELDSRSAHLRVKNFESDRARDRAATVAGWRVVRITWLQLARERPALAADLAALLAAPSAAARSS